MKILPIKTVRGFSKTLLILFLITKTAGKTAKLKKKEKTIQLKTVKAKKKEKTIRLKMEKLALMLLMEKMESKKQIAQK